MLLKYCIDFWGEDLNLFFYLFLFLFSFLFVLDELKWMRWIDGRRIRFYVSNSKKKQNCFLCCRCNRFGFTAEIITGATTKSWAKERRKCVVIWNKMYSDRTAEDWMGCVPREMEMFGVAARQKTQTEMFLSVFTRRLIILYLNPSVMSSLALEYEVKSL